MNRQQIKESEKYIDAHGENKGIEEIALKLGEKARKNRNTLERQRRGEAQNEIGERACQGHPKKGPTAVVKMSGIDGDGFCPANHGQMGKNAQSGKKNGSEKIYMRDRIKSKPPRPFGRVVSITQSHKAMGNLMEHDGKEKNG